MSNSLSDHFDETVDDHTYRFSHRSATPVSTRDALVNALADIVACNKTDPHVTQVLVAAAGWEVAMAPLMAGHIAVRRGDFAEALAAEAAEDFDGMHVPVHKLRYQIDPNQTLPGSDVAAFKLDDDGTILGLDFVESKHRTRPRADIAVEAHKQLLADRDGGYATTLNFLALRIKELEPVLFDQFIEYLADRDVKDFSGTVSLSCDADHWNVAIAENLNEVSELLPELWLRVFHLERVTELIDEVYESLGWEPTGDE